MSREVDILDREIKGLTGRFILWMIGGVGSIIVFVMGTYFSTTDQIKESEHRLMAEIKGMKAEQRLVDTIQSRDIQDLQSKLALKVK